PLRSTSRHSTTYEATGATRTSSPAHKSPDTMWQTRSPRCADRPRKCVCREGLSVRRQLSGRGHRGALAADHRMLELGKSGVSLDPLPETRRSAVRPFHLPVILGLLSEDLESVSRQEATKCPAGECIGVPLVDMEGGQHLVEEGPPYGVNVHRQVERATRREDSRNLPNDLRGCKGMIDDVVDDHERERGATKRESLPGAREIGRAWFSEPDQTRSLSVELFERIDRIALAPLESIDDPDGTAPDFEDSAGVRSRNRNRGEVLFESTGFPVVPIELAFSSVLDARGAPLPEGLLVFLRRRPASSLDLRASDVR